MKILTALTYYRPYTSGLTLYAARVAAALAHRGHTVSVLTARHDPVLQKREMIEGVDVIRVNVGLRIGKALLMPGLPLRAWGLVSAADILHLHLPQFDAALLAIFGRLLGKKVVLTYHCDLELPPGLVNRLANLVSNLVNHISANLADVIVTNTQDYADHSPFLRRYRHKVQAVLPPAQTRSIDISSTAARARFLDRLHLTTSGTPCIGMASRLASEKGVEYLAQALLEVLERFPNAHVLYVGEHENVPGEQAYIRKVKALTEPLAEHWHFLGNLPDDEMAVFFKACDLTVLPSLNSTESFGLVQVESMAAGTPVVASDLPGVRQPVRMTGMGEIVPPHDAHALAQAILRILNNPTAYHSDPRTLTEATRPQNVALAYETIFQTP